MARTYRAHWPASNAAAATRIADPSRTLAERLAGLEAWRAEADPLIAGLERPDAQARTLADQEETVRIRWAAAAR